MSTTLSKQSNIKFSPNIKTSWGSGIINGTTPLWRDVNPSRQTIIKRESFRQLVDEFATFSWRGVDAFNTFGAFIINEKNNIQFFNGAGFTNEYSKPQYSTNGNDLVGINFNIQKLQFKIGVYWINIHDYRRFIEWLDPYEIDYLSFGYNQNFSYLVKLAERKDSPRMVVGKEGDTFMYYTEFNLVFEVQGESCVRANVPYETSAQFVSVSEGAQVYRLSFPSNPVNKTSDLDVPFNIVIPLDLTSDNDSYAAEVELTISAHYQSGSNTTATILGKASLVNLNQRQLPSADNLIYTRPDSAFESNDSLRLNLKYDSEAGLMFIQFGDGTYKLLSLQSTAGSGERLLSSLEISKFKIPGLFSTPGFNLNNFYINLSIKLKDNNGAIITVDNADHTTIATGAITLIPDDLELIAYARTNIA